MKRKKSLVLLLILTLVLTMTIPVSAAVKISNKSITLIAGQKKTIKVTGTKKKAKWSTSKSSVATVTQSGVVTAKKKGTATITAKIDSKKYTCKVTVETPSISKKSVSITAGKSYALKMNGTKQKVTWKSSNTAVATVSSGKVTAKAAGTTTITATVLGKKYTCKVTVKATTISGEKWILPNQKECGDATFAISLDSGTPEIGEMPSSFVQEWVIKAGLPIGCPLNMTIRNATQSTPTRIYVDGEQIDVELCGAETYMSVLLSNKYLHEGIHYVEMVQFQNNNAKEKVLAYRRAKYKIYYK